MRNELFIEGQISIFELPVIEVEKSKENVIREEQNIKLDKLDSLIELYSKSCSRIVKTLSGALLVELDDKTLYFNSNGINEFYLHKDVAIMPEEEIIIANMDKELIEVQKQKLEALKPQQYIKRKGDCNLIIPGEKTLVINPKGWVLEYMQKTKYKENEIFSTEFDFKIKEVGRKITEAVIDITDVIDINFKVDEDVNIEYQGIKAIGKVVRIYNNGETLNVKWDGKQTAFYYKNVRKVKEIMLT